jgi:hypothetical protein
MGGPPPSLAAQFVVWTADPQSGRSANPNPTARNGRAKRPRLFVGGVAGLTRAASEAARTRSCSVILIRNRGHDVHDSIKNLKIFGLSVEE